MHHLHLSVVLEMSSTVPSQLSLPEHRYHTPQSTAGLCTFPYLHSDAFPVPPGFPKRPAKEWEVPVFYSSVCLKGVRKQLDAVFSA